ncbi:hypothetical protein LCGC14_2719690 [marine sediment metagenome]|uniref:Uncharacterized protein n=1 Tax=marine sediment metagenome TaxID=412755 RepID=A0A0F9BJK7_9ZZZZ
MLCLLIAGCAERAPVSRFAEPELVAMQEDVTPPEARPGICHSRDNTPAQIETVTEQIQVAPPELAEDGRVLTPAILGLNSNVLSTAAAKRLGLIVYDRDEALATI